MNRFNPTNESWSGLKTQLRKTWRKLTDGDLDIISRDHEQLVQIVRDRYRPHVVRQAIDVVSCGWTTPLRPRKHSEWN
jgi:hypothetical protein